MKVLIKVLLCSFSALLLLATSPVIPSIYAADNTKLIITSSQYFKIDETNKTQINFYEDSEKLIQTGSVQVKLANDQNALTPSLSESGCEYNISFGANPSVTVELQPSSEYIAPSSYTFEKKEISLTSTTFDLTLSSDKPNELNFDFLKGGGDNPPPPLMVDYPIIALFDVPGRNPIKVQWNSDNSLVIPENWIAGKVSFEAAIFINNNGDVEPFNGQTSGGTRSTIPLLIEGIANGEEIHNTVTKSPDKKFITISEGFSEYGKVLLHLLSEKETSADINQLQNVVHSNLINVKALAPLSLSQSFGTVALNQAIITKDEIKDVCIFFGNTQATLIASGPTVDKITAVSGNSLKNVSLNDNDGSATVTLSTLSTETTTPVEITIKKLDGSSITRRINIVRTAIQLGQLEDRGKPAVYAGYVVNKAYLYNNQPHNDDIFNAYLQVILYKDNTVMGYKQIKIDDEELVNNLFENQSGSLELYSDKKIAIYGEDAGNYIEGVNKVSVFLTNGPIDFNSETLPSVEFGIGSGVTILFGGAAND